MRRQGRTGWEWGSDGADVRLWWLPEWEEEEAASIDESFMKLSNEEKRERL